MLEERLALKKLPSGLLTVMFTDIVNSTKLKGLMEGETSARRDTKFRTLIKDPHDNIILTSVEEAQGQKVNSTGDGFCFVFTDAEEAVLCALKIQELLLTKAIHTPIGQLQVRIGLHSGIADSSGDDYVASTVDKAARVQSKADGNQVFVSRETHALVVNKLREVSFNQAGTFDLKGLEPEDLYLVTRFISGSPRAACSKDRHLNEQIRRNLGRLLRGQCWVGYDPSTFDPLVCPKPALASIQADLESIRAAGFTGVVTFCSRGTLAEIPSLAKGLGLAVIMGVWDASDPHEVELAIERANSVDAYCVGHNGLRDDRYLFEDVEAAMREIREQTEKPVSTSEEVRFYRENQNLAALGDWLFPDIHLSLQAKLNAGLYPEVEHRVEQSLALAREVATFGQRYRRPLALKLLVFPWKGAQGVSLELQRSFFAQALDRLSSPEVGLNVPTAYVAHSAFDAPWKQRVPFHPWDPYTGLLEADGTARPAVCEIVQRRWYAT
jgi:class 3 adenylate cyclase/exo-beta-1,3-glucanase (GH17 family)